jgi:hypothetical protein
LRKAWNETVTLVEEEKDENRIEKEQRNLSLFKTLDIPQEKQNAFFQSLITKYGDQFRENEALKDFVLKQITLNQNEAHALKLDYVGIEQLLLKEEPNITELLTQFGLYPRPGVESQAEEVLSNQVSAAS